MIHFRMTFVMIHTKRNEPSQHYSPTSASKGEEVGKRPIFAALFGPMTKLFLLLFARQHTVTESRCAFSCYLLTNTADRPTNNILLYYIGGHLCPRICQKPRYLSKLERRARWRLDSADTALSYLRIFAVDACDKTAIFLSYLGRHGLLFESVCVCMCIHAI